MNRIEFVIRCDCGAEVRSPGMERSRLRAVIAAFDESHDPGCLASLEPLANAIPEPDEPDTVAA